MQNRIVTALSVVGDKGVNFDYRTSKFAFEDFNKFEFVFFAEFDGPPGPLLYGPISLFKERIALYLRRDVEVIGAKLGCVLIFFGANGVSNEVWREFLEHQNVGSLLAICKIKTLFGGGIYVRKRYGAASPTEYSIGE